VFSHFLSGFLLRGMSLAMYAAPFDETHSSISNDDNYIHKKKQSHNKTQKMFQKEGFTNNASIINSGSGTVSGTNTNFNSKKVNSVLEHLHNKSIEDDDEDEQESRIFSPPPPPQSSGSERKAITENYKLLGNTPQPSTSENDFDLNNYQSNYHNSKSMESYYKKMLPEYSNNNYSSQTNHPYYKYDSMNSNNFTNSTNSNSQDVLLQKLNYMIHLLEEQQDERTNNVTEEVVLYSFLGIFIIFIADSFVRIGKYVR
jgi:hypothetical protein